MDWITKKTIAETLHETFAPPPADDEFAALLARLDKLTGTEAEPTPDPE